MNAKEAVKVLREAATDEAKAIAFFEATRWPEGTACPRCGSVNVRQMVAKSGQREAHYRWRCRDCKRQFTVRTGTVFEETRLPMRAWAHAYWRCSASKKGVSALQISRELAIGYRHALFLLNRIRFGMKERPDAAKLTGIVEADEVYIGGAPRPKNNQLPSQAGKQGPKGNLVPVMAAVQRNGSVRARPLAKITGDNLRSFLLDNVDTSARLMTDESHFYWRPGRLFASHEAVRHRAKEYARGDVTTNRVEGFFSLFRRKLHGTHHAVSREHLFRYVDEAAFIYNTRTMTDGDRIATAIKASEGKRLTYREPEPAAE